MVWWHVILTQSKIIYLERESLSEGLATLSWFVGMSVEVSGLVGRAAHSMWCYFLGKASWVRVDQMS